MREWSRDGYAKVADALIDRHKANIILTGSDAETKISKDIASLMKNKPIMIAGKLNLKQLASLLKKCKMLICGNTGIMHLACACGTPTVALHGPTDPVRWGPLGEKNIVIQSDIPCSPCLYLGFEYGCKKPKCMELITVDMVLRATESIIS
jgi:ADP-heptose:LPS heptosyltransferase